MISRTLRIGGTVLISTPSENVEAISFPLNIGLAFLKKIRKVKFVTTNEELYKMWGHARIGYDPKILELMLANQGLQVIQCSWLFNYLSRLLLYVLFNLMLSSSFYAIRIKLFQMVAKIDIFSDGKGEMLIKAKKFTIYNKN